MDSDLRSQVSKLQISVLIRADTYEHIRNHALSNKAYGAYIDNLVQKERIKGVTLEQIDNKLNLVLERLNHWCKPACL